MSEPFTFKQRGLLIWLSAVGLSAVGLSLLEPGQRWIQGVGMSLFVLGSVATHARTRTGRVEGLPPSPNRAEGWLSATGLVLFLAPFAARGIQFILPRGI